MNKMIVDSEYIELNDFSGFIEYKVKSCKILVKNKVLLNEITSLNNLDLTIILEDNASLVYNRYGVLSSNNKINIIENNNTSIIFNEAIISDNELNLEINNELRGNNNISNIRVRCVANENATIIMNGKVLESTKNNTLLEDLRGLNLSNARIKIVPNMLIGTDEVVANHNVTISNVSESDLFYLNSKGISKKVATSLLKRAFLTSIFDLEFKTKID